MDEFSLIRRYFSDIGGDSGVVLGVGDDAALLRPTAGCELAVTTDTLIAGRHFPIRTAAADIGWKALAVNLSDLAAMGALPRWCTLALSLPDADADWLREFAAGFAALAHTHGVALVGGDTTRGPLSLSVTAMGEVPTGRAIRRDTAHAGDCICVTGALGDAALALQRLNAASTTMQSEDDLALRARLDRPQPRVAEGLALRGIASAAIDLSDGLIGDLGHILERSQVGGEIRVDALPSSAAFARLALPAERADLQLAGGDDYELCLCVPEGRLDAARAAIASPLSVIGRIVEGRGLRVLGADGATMSPSRSAYRHFE
ncbi:thiamine-phosphate kinase [Sinimarinibacterium sp. CAU 1509]|uniref:thiamine-phosphate kinase n=1 Tax=Sinimarinibacterium sp. CAU 1509 TaxID=2562283 RepID=UPI0010ABA128|nr:thiamine-phosphate kinase [Sinimarinibacterium sp. CAU 1509]TJY60870.1 thiamine-phosphate kinase [Sinimarinibacterium sp. CAU 1509]